MHEKIIRKNENLKPFLQTYSCVSKYLSDYYEYRKRTDSKFSYEIWALQLGFKSKSTLRLICNGQRNVSNLFAELFSHKEKFNERETAYFLLLARLQNTKNLALKKIYLDKVAELTDISGKKKSIKNSLLFLSNPILSKIQLIISFEDFNATEANLKNILNIESVNLRESLKTLENLDLIESFYLENEKNKVYRSKAHYFSFTESIHDEAIKIFHRHTLKEVDEILNHNNLDKKFKSLFFSLSKEDYIDLNETLDNFSNRLKVKYGNNQIKRKKLYKINLQAYPVTDTCE